MEKVIVELFVPAAEQSFDVYIPVSSQIWEVRNLLVAAIGELTEGKYLPSTDAALCDSVGSIINVNMTVGEHGIRNGSRLMLI